jgi:hypothetical protein
LRSSLRPSPASAADLDNLGPGRSPQNKRKALEFNFALGARAREASVPASVGPEYRRSGNDFQATDLAAVESEFEPQDDGASRKLSPDFGRHIHIRSIGRNCSNFCPVIIFRGRCSDPCPDCVRALMITTFIFHDGGRGKA